LQTSIYGKVKKKIIKRGLCLFLLSIPFMIYIILFCYVPLFGWSLAFFDYKPGMDWGNLNFAGLKYFKLIFQFWSDTRNALINTIALSALNYLFAPLPMILAILLYELRNSKLRKFIQTVVTLPNFVSWIIVYSLCFSIFSWDGLLNQILNGLGLIDKPVQLLGDAKNAWIFQTLVGQWKCLGWSSIVYLAAIAGIDTQLYDAAKVDGASRLGCVIHVTLPGILPTFLVLFVISIGNILSVGFDQYFVFNNPMVSSKLEVLDLYTYRLGIGTQDFSFATAVGILKSIISIASIFLINAFAKRIRGETII